MALVSVQNVKKSFFRGEIEVPVLTQLSLEVQEGEFVALMGPSGSGKTTLLNMIAGLDKPLEGRVVVAGTDITQLSENELAKWRSRHIGFVFQLYHLIPVLTAFENVELPLLLTKLSKEERKRHVETALKVVGLEDRMDHYPRQLSGGQEQRVGIARAIVTDPTLIIADEPTGDLDATSAQEILDLLDQLNVQFKKTIIIATHDPRAAEKAHRVEHLDKGVLHRPTTNATSHSTLPFTGNR